MFKLVDRDRAGFLDVDQFGSLIATVSHHLLEKPFISFRLFLIPRFQAGSLAIGRVGEEIVLDCTQ